MVPYVMLGYRVTYRERTMFLLYVCCKRHLPECKNPTMHRARRLQNWTGEATAPQPAVWVYRGTDCCVLRAAGLSQVLRK